MSRPRIRPVTGRPVGLVTALNAALGLRLTDAAEARRWLADGEWPVLDAWIAARCGAASAPSTASSSTQPEEATRYALTYPDGRVAHVLCIARAALGRAA